MLFQQLRGRRVAATWVVLAVVMMVGACVCEASEVTTGTRTGYCRTFTDAAAGGYEIQTFRMSHRSGRPRCMRDNGRQTCPLSA